MPTPRTARRQTSRRAWAFATLLTLAAPSTAAASDFGCPAEWLGMASIIAPVVGLAWAIAARWVASSTHTTVASSAGLATAFALLATDCPYGNDPDGFGLAMTVVGVAVALVAGRWVRSRWAKPPA